jgi:signal transduction histidine kinase
MTGARLASQAPPADDQLIGRSDPGGQQLGSVPVLIAPMSRSTSGIPAHRNHGRLCRAAIAGSQPNEQQSRLTLLEERERIGMELHDGVIQSLYALGMHIELLRTSGNVEADELMPVIDGLNQVIEDIRRYILNLKSSTYHQKTIHESFQEILDRLHIPGTLTVEIDAPHDAPLTPAAFQGICLIANEAISNAVRHASASRIHISVRQTDRYFRITIADDGKGFNLAAMTQQSGLGLRNIHQRARLHGGEIRIDTAPNKGTSVTINIPV